MCLGTIQLAGGVLLIYLGAVGLGDCPASPQIPRFMIGTKAVTFHTVAYEKVQKNLLFITGLGALWAFFCITPFWNFFSLVLRRPLCCPPVSGLWLLFESALLMAYSIVYAVYIFG